MNELSIYKSIKMKHNYLLFNNFGIILIVVLNKLYENKMFFLQIFHILFEF